MAKRILVVDDDKAIREVYKSLFKVLTDYEISVAINGAKGLNVARNELPDLILTETEMPNMSGIELCRAIKQDPNTQHIRVIGTSNNPNYEPQYREVQADVFYKKPFYVGDILDKIKEILGE